MLVGVPVWLECVQSHGLGSPYVFHSMHITSEVAGRKNTTSEAFIILKIAANMSTYC